jgi:PleD family two-component response regulator
MDMFARLDIRVILPQHGAIIKERIPMYIDALKNLECGALLKPIKKHIMDSGGYLMLFKEVFTRYKALFDATDVETLFTHCGCFSFDEQNNLIDYDGAPESMWNHMFEEIYALKGMQWLIVIDPYIKRLTSQYDILPPKIFSTLLTTISEENKRLSDEKAHLENTIHIVNERLIKCPITGLYNERFFKTLMLEELENEDWRDIGAYACIDIDDFSKYKLKHGVEQSKDALSSMIYMIGEAFGTNTAFKMDQSDFGLYIRGYESHELIRRLDSLRIAIAQSDAFLSPLTVSMGVAFQNELVLDAPTYDTVVESYITLAYDRMRRAKHLGKNILCFEGAHEVSASDILKILLVDSDDTNLEIIKVFVKEMNIDVLTARDGITAQEIAFSEQPSLVVSEINLPRLDGFLLRESLLENSRTKNIPMIFLSYQKDEASVTRAQQLGISHYFKKPYMLYELLGIIKYYIKG